MKRLFSSIGFFVAVLFKLCTASNRNKNKKEKIEPFSNYPYIQPISEYVAHQIFSPMTPAGKLWKIYYDQLDSLMKCCDTILSHIEQFPEQAIPFCSMGKKEKTTACLHGLYIRLLGYKKMMYHLSLVNSKNLNIQIAGMRYIQFVASDHWAKLCDLDEFATQVYKESYVNILHGYPKPEEERNKAIIFSNYIVQLANLIQRDVSTMQPMESFLVKNLSFFLHRILMANCALYGIELKRDPSDRPVVSLEGEMAEFEKIEYVHDHEYITFAPLQGFEMLPKYLDHVNMAAIILIFYALDNDEAIAKVGQFAALYTLKSMLNDEMGPFFDTGKITSIASRHLLQVIIKRKDYVGLDPKIVAEAIEQFERLKLLALNDRQHVVKTPKKKKSRSKLTAPKKNPKPRKQSKSKFESRKNPPKRFSRPSSKDIVIIGSDNFFESLKFESLSLIDLLPVYYIQAGQFCFDRVLLPVLGRLNLHKYSWRLVSEMCSTTAGLEALAALGLNQSQVDMCISIVRDRAAYAHPSDFGDVALVQDDLGVLKRHHPEMKSIFDEIRQKLSVESGWNVVPGCLPHITSSAHVGNADHIKALFAALRVGEFCWRKVFEPAAGILGLDVEANSLSEIIEGALAIGMDASDLIMCKSLIKLRNRYAHEAVPADKARQAIKAILGDDFQKMSILEPVLADINFKESSGVKFY